MDRSNVKGPSIGGTGVAVGPVKVPTAGTTVLVASGSELGFRMALGGGALSRSPGIVKRTLSSDIGLKGGLLNKSASPRVPSTSGATKRSSNGVVAPPESL